MTIPLETARTVHVTPRFPGEIERARLTDGLRSVDLGPEGVTLTVPTDAELALIGPRLRPAVLRAPDPTWAPELEPARVIRARCAGGLWGLCGFAPTCRAEGEPTEAALPCRLDSEGWTCDCPLDDAIVAGPGVEVTVPEGSGLAVLDGGWTGAIEGEVAPGTHAFAHRALSLTERLFGATAPDVQVFDAAEDGHLRLSSLPPGRWTVRLRHDGHETHHSVVVDDGTVTLP